MDLKDSTTYNNATSLTVYDAKGQDVAVTFYFQKSATTAAASDTWNVYATANGTPFDTDSTGAAIALDANGNPTTPYTTITFPPTGGSPSAILGQRHAAGGDTMPCRRHQHPRQHDAAHSRHQLDPGGAAENGSSFA
jgi:flagellar hook protein FlgE